MRNLDVAAYNGHISRDAAALLIETLKSLFPIHLSAPPTTTVNICWI
jgi:hypothetical protein